jgi:tetratricopeptide (TPR) repeat protein
MYFWRMSPQCPPEYRQKTPAGQAALIKETEFALKQAFAFCPYSAEAVQRYMIFLAQMAQSEELAGHADQAGKYFDDAILVGETCQKLDPYNPQIKNLIDSVKSYRNQITENAKALTQAANQLAAMETTARTNPADVQNLVTLGNNYLQMRQTGRAVQLFDTALTRPEINLEEAEAIAQAYAQMQDLPKLEVVLHKLVALAPDQPEPRLNLADLEAVTGRSTQAVADIKVALDLNAKRLAQNPAAHDLAADIRNDPRFAPIRNLPEYQKLFPAK